MLVRGLCLDVVGCPQRSHFSVTGGTHQNVTFVNETVGNVGRVVPFVLPCQSALYAHGWKYSGGVMQDSGGDGPYYGIPPAGGLAQQVTCAADTTPRMRITEWDVPRGTGSGSGTTCILTLQSKQSAAAGGTYTTLATYSGWSHRSFNTAWLEQWRTAATGHTTLRTVYTCGNSARATATACNSQPCSGFSVEWECQVNTVTSQCSASELQMASVALALRDDCTVLWQLDGQPGQELVTDLLLRPQVLWSGPTVRRTALREVLSAGTHTLFYRGHSALIKVVATASNGTVLAALTNPHPLVRQSSGCANSESMCDVEGTATFLLTEPTSVAVYVNMVGQRASCAWYIDRATKSTECVLLPGSYSASLRVREPGWDVLLNASDERVVASSARLQSDGLLGAGRRRALQVSGATTPQLDPATGYLETKLDVTIPVTGYLLDTVPVLPQPVQCSAGEMPDVAGMSCGCDPGFTRSGELTPVPGTDGTKSQRACVPCADGKEPEATSMGVDPTRCVPCTVGVSNSETDHVCRPCPAGSQPSASLGVCELCMAGTFSSDGQACVLCTDWRLASQTPPGGLVPASHYGGTTREADCACPPGHYSFTFASGCMRCADIEVPIRIEGDRPTPDYILAVNDSIGAIPETPFISNETHQTCPGGLRGAAQICPIEGYYVTTYTARWMLRGGRGFWQLAATLSDGDEGGSSLQSESQSAGSGGDGTPVVVAVPSERRSHPLVVRALAVPCHTPGVCLDGAEISQRNATCPMHTHHPDAAGGMGSPAAAAAAALRYRRRALRTTERPATAVSDAFRCAGYQAGVACASCVDGPYVRVKGVCVECDGVNWGAICWQLGVYTIIAAGLLKKSLGKLKSWAALDIWLFLLQTMSLISKESDHFGIADRVFDVFNIEPSHAVGGCTVEYGVFGEFFVKVMVVPCYLLFAVTALGFMWNKLQDLHEFSQIEHIFMEWIPPSLEKELAMEEERRQFTIKRVRCRAIAAHHGGSSFLKKGGQLQFDEGDEIVLTHVDKESGGRWWYGYVQSPSASLAVLKFPMAKVELLTAKENKSLDKVQEFREAVMEGLSLGEKVHHVLMKLLHKVVVLARNEEANRCEKWNLYRGYVAVLLFIYMPFSRGTLEMFLCKKIIPGIGQPDYLKLDLAQVCFVPMHTW
eukprot:SAG25_NODE_54_length_18691_cov_566.202076_16_plen_1159_part_00